MTKKIGLPIWKLGENSVGSTLSCILFAEQFGEVIPLMPKHTIRKDLDLLILPGGPDINPLMYGEMPSFMTSKPDLQKDYFDNVYLPRYIANGTPILGLCRGHQAIAVAFAGKLIQHMVHEKNKDEDPFKCVHKIALDVQNFPILRSFSNIDTIPVNSRHHQAVRENSLPNDLAVVARHPQTQHVEMIAHMALPIVGMQFHPEDIYEDVTCEFVDKIVFHLINNRKSILQE